MSKRDDFKLPTKEQMARRVGMRCSNPHCRQLTVGPKGAAEGSVSIGVAAHITAASKNGPRFDESLTPEARQSFDNGIWLCQNCGKLVDNDEQLYTVELLHEWKNGAEEATRKELQGAAAQFRAAKADQILSLLNCAHNVHVRTLIKRFPEIATGDLHGTRSANNPRRIMYDEAEGLARQLTENDLGLLFDTVPSLLEVGGDRPVWSRVQLR